MGLTLADVVHPVYVFQNIGIVLRELFLCGFLVILPENLAFQVTDGEIVGVPGALAALDELAHLAAATVNLAAHRVHVYAVLHCEVGAEEVILVACDAALA
jgi:hypothetical protein